LTPDEKYRNLVNELDKANIVNEENIAKLKDEIAKIKQVLKDANIMSLDA